MIKYHFPFYTSYLDSSICFPLQIKSWKKNGKNSSMMPLILCLIQKKNNVASSTADSISARQLLNCPPMDFLLPPLSYL